MSVKNFKRAFSAEKVQREFLAKSEVFAPATSTCGISFVTFLLKEKLTLNF
jgi:hypothetical protein